MIALTLVFVMGLIVGHVIGWRRGRALLNRDLKSLSDVVSQTGEASDSLAESVSRNKQTK